MLSSFWVLCFFFLLVSHVGSNQFQGHVPDSLGSLTTLTRLCVVILSFQLSWLILMLKFIVVQELDEQLFQGSTPCQFGESQQPGDFRLVQQCVERNDTSQFLFPSIELAGRIGLAK